VQNKALRHLRMPCCDVPAIMKSSTRGLHFFAHKSRGECTSAPESEEHLFLKCTAVAAARKAGWVCSTEVRGVSPFGGTWTADVLAQRGKRRVAIEVQWSGQTYAEMHSRQERYRQSDIRCLWLVRGREFQASKEVPAVCVVGDLTAGFEARIGDCQSIPLADFFDAVFEGRFRYGIAVGASATVSIHSGVLSCWKSNCQARTRIVTVIEVAAGPHRCQFTVADLGKFPDLLAAVLERIPLSPGVGAIKVRYSRTLQHSYMSNGCYRCDALIGEHFEHDAWYSDESVLAAFPITISDRWLEAIETDREGSFGWAVYAA
jgi:phage gp37-like protein